MAGSLDKILKDTETPERKRQSIDGVRVEYHAYLIKHNKIYPELNQIMKGVSAQVFQEFAARLDQVIESQVAEPQKIETLAAELGWRSPRHLSEWRYAKGTYPSYQNLVRMAVLGEFSLTWLLFGRGPMYMSELAETDREKVLDTLIKKSVSSRAQEPRADALLRQAKNELGEETVYDILLAELKKKHDGIRTGRLGDGAVDEGAMVENRKRSRGGKKKSHRKS